MSTRVQIKDTYSETRLIHRRLIIAAIFVFILMSIVLSRLYVLQVVDNEHFTTLSNSNRVRIKALPPTRGLIYDRNGIELANNRPSYQLEIIKEEVDDLDDTLTRLKQHIHYTERDLKRYQQLSIRRRPFESIPLRFNLNDEEVASLSVNLHQFQGVEINARLTRNYPLGKHAVHALGYVGRIDENDLYRIDETNYVNTSHIGKLGLERFYEKELHGEVGIQRIEVNATGRTLRVLSEIAPEPGNNLYLSLDSNLQQVAELAFGDQNGAAVAIDPQNGEVLALVSMPTFDPNLFVNGISHKAYDDLRLSKNRPLFNRALSGQYPPGSTTKPFFGLAALEHKTITWNKPVFCKGYYQLPNDERKYRDWKKKGHGFMRMKNAITQSCDVYFYDLAYNLGIDRMSPFLAQFGFGKKTQIDSTSERPGLLPSRKWKNSTKGQPWYPGETLITGIGQGAFLATPLQLANATAAMSQAGKRYKPQLMRAIEYPADSDILEQKTEIAGEYSIQKRKNWNYIVDSMKNVVHGYLGTAYRIGSTSKYKIAGKTGTSQVFTVAQDEEYDEKKISKKLRDHALFIGFAPVDKPKIAIAVIVENGGHGGATAAPIARKIMDAYLLNQIIETQG